MSHSWNNWSGNLQFTGPPVKRQPTSDRLSAGPRLVQPAGVVTKRPHPSHRWALASRARLLDTSINKMKIDKATICLFIGTGIHFSDWRQFQSPTYLHSQVISACHTAIPANHEWKNEAQAPAVTATLNTLLKTHIKHGTLQAADTIYLCAITVTLQQTNSVCWANKQIITSWDSVENSKFGPSTTASTGQASWQNPQYMHLVISMSYLQLQSKTLNFSFASRFGPWPKSQVDRMPIW